MTTPDSGGHFGPYGGRYVPETLMSPLQELEEAWKAARTDPAFLKELDDYLRTFAGRPTPLYRADNLSARVGGGTRVYLKREDLAHTGRGVDMDAHGRAVDRCQMRLAESSERSPNAQTGKRYRGL